jgi:hypothetical protein
VSNTASLQEARKAYKSLVKVFHPDLNSATPEQAAQATQATARINQAWDTLEDLAKRGLLGKFVDDPREEEAAGSSFRLRPRHPNWSECIICGSTPATNVDFRFVQTFLVWLQTGSLSGAFCRACGSEVFRDAQSRSLVRGWWGIGVVALPFFLVGNLVARRKVRDQQMPSYRDFRVVTPTDQPLLPGRPVFKRPSVILAVAVVLVAGVGVVWAGLTPSSTTRTPSVAAAPTEAQTSAPAPKPSPSSSAPRRLTGEQVQLLLQSVYDRGIEVGNTKRQAQCVADAVGEFTATELSEFASGDLGSRLEAKWEGIIYTCSQLRVGDCITGQSAGFASVECSDPRATWKVAEAPVYAFVDSCSGYPEAIQSGSRVYCLKRNK